MLLIYIQCTYFTKTNPVPWRSQGLLVGAICLKWKKIKRNLTHVHNTIEKGKYLHIDPNEINN